MAYGTVNADVIQTSTSGGILGAGDASAMKNRIINGNFVISQYNGSSSVNPTDNTCFIDRWKATIYPTASKFTVQQNAGSVTPPVGFTNYLGITSSSAYTSGSTDQYFLNQRIEGFNFADLGWGTANAKTVTLSFWVYSSLATTFGGSIINSAGNRAYPFSYTTTATNTWQQVSITIAGETTGTWGTTNNIGALVVFNLGSGSATAGTAGAWVSAERYTATGSTNLIATNGATLYLTGVQLEVRSSATGFEYRQYTTELCLCQRYFEQSYTYGKTAGSSTDTEAVVGNAAYATSTTVLDYGTTTFFKVQKRATPSIAFYQSNGTANIWGYSPLGNYTTVGQWINTNGFGFYTTVASGATTNRTYMVYGHFTASAEL